MIGSKHGTLTVLAVRRVPDGHGSWKFVADCTCECGAKTTIDKSNLKRVKSCGCLRYKLSAEASSTHGHTRHGGRSAEYRSWNAMKTRCTNPNQSDWHNYGGRGVKVCDRWMNSFESFLADMGPKPTPSHSIDRYPNADGDYEPGNCRWATPFEQSRNTAQNRVLENGMPLCDAAIAAGVSYSAMRWRLNNGWTLQEALAGQRNKKEKTK